MNRPKHIALFALLTALALGAGGAASFALLAWSHDRASERVDPPAATG